MNRFFGRQYSAEDLQHLAQAQRNGRRTVSMMGGDFMDSSMIGGQSLDEMISQNNKELQRRQSLQPQYPNEPEMHGENMRKGSGSMMGFGVGSSGDLDRFQFQPSTATAGPSIDAVGVNMTAPHADNPDRRQSTGGLALNTAFQTMGPGFDMLSAPASAYQSPMQTQGPLSLDMSSNYANAGMPMNLDFTSGPMNQVPSGEATPMDMDMYAQQSFQSALAAPPMHQNFLGAVSNTFQDQGTARISPPDLLEANDASNAPDALRNTQLPNKMQGMQLDLHGGEMGDTDGSPIIKNQENDAMVTSADSSALSFQTPRSFPPGMASRVDASHPQNVFQNAYSSSGFDMMNILMRVATRPNPEISIGAVDMSCAFVVCDVAHYDIPIIYCSEVFERLTGYSKHEILGRNCRFLQAPDGKVQSGIKRKYVDDDSVLYLKNMIAQRKEAQISLINYRKGGQPFMNLLTMIPISVSDPGEIKFYVGFQVDLVEQPNSVTNKNPDGSYAINYQRGYLPNYVFQSPDHSNQADMGQTIGRDEVSTVLSTIGSGESELSRRIWDKVLLENTDDVVHVLSLKGLFLYLSPSSRKVLEYDASELVGTALSSVCHPSDIVPVTRELKDTSSGSPVNVVFRIRRKFSGYMWFESHGSLHTEQGKGRKCIILVGRERPVFALSRKDISGAGGFAENDMWAKMSTSGMLLFVTSNVRTLLDRQADDLVGTSIQLLMRSDSKKEFGRVLELARTGRQASFKHEMQNKRGQVLRAQTTVYPGDAAEGQKPTFLVAQTRLLKLSRSMPPPTNPKLGDHGSGNSTPSAYSGASSNNLQLQGQDSANGSPSNHVVDQLWTAAGGSALALGSQDEALASEDNVFEELKTTRSTSWQYELRQMEKRNRLLAEELQGLLASKKKRKRRKGAGHMQKDCANCHTRVTPEWRRGPSGNRDLCNSCGLRWAKQNGRVSPRTSSQHSDKQGGTSVNVSPNGVANAVVGSSGGNQIEKRSPQMANANSHAAKTARMEAHASQGYGGGIPERIEEAVEPE
ncbi:MAG: hypothetical protein M1819_003065 [Sarea resinae]|nr:MAG: hypothetical protein M1819_003065 [Sarea resinae]